MEPTTDNTPRYGTWTGLVEVGLIFLLFFLYAGWHAPDVNEAHYLAKAKHYWNPDWCPGDHFLESADAHWFFYWTFGQLTRWFPLPAVAWIGRLATWLLLAWSWRRLSWVLVPRPLYSVLSAALMICLLHRCQMAGEWIVGGVEAKGFAYVLVFLGIASIVRGQWHRVWLYLGAAAAFHVLVGGWSVVAAGIAWLLCGGRDERPRLVAMLPALAAGFALSLPGLLPALMLNRDVDAETIRQANQIYVLGRLPHHLLLHTFPPRFIVRFAAMTVVWGSVCWLCRDDRGNRRLARFVAAALAIAAVGTCIDLATLHDPALASALLRYYWFRLADAIVPVGTALSAMVLLARLGDSRPRLWQWLLVGAMALPIANQAGIFLQRRADWRPRADAQSLPRFHGNPKRTWTVYEDWRQMCGWAADNTPPDARFLTPMRQQTFKWYAGRSEVVSAKDIPQDARGIVQWRNRRRDLFPPDPEASLHNASARRIRQLAERYDFDYVVLERASGRPKFLLPRVYANRTYAVYRVRSNPYDGSPKPSKLLNLR